MKTSTWLNAVFSGGLVLLAAGCVAFRGGEMARLPRAEKPQGPVADKVILAVTLSHDGKPSEHREAVDSHAKLVLRAAAESGGFREVHRQVPGATLKPGEFMLKYDIDNWGSGFATGIPLFVIPSFATDHFTVQAELVNGEGKSRWKRTYHDKATAVFWIGFLPSVLVPPCYPVRVQNSVLNNIYRHSIQDMIENAAFPTPATTE